ncbi:hypothetical protein LOTGIDRAFT_222496 [Lottia gigantea]|uniref:Histone deacetylase domain-containing protein n=1 Tax=Lottia gigantea TaxID=225164 RepID=V3YZL6_LOTGI|nr:hypothetical protein LOTGIDRAFT_222496 [Lottia gigantea]ESO83648.1 hypothetical protein LOTGIDRAFT_222496 [Lottia gigantea]
MASPCRRTGLGYDETLAKHYSLWNPDFTEQPDRILEPYDRCQLYNLIERCQPIQHRIASQEDMELLHTKEHIEILKSSETMNEEELKQLSTKYDYIYFHNDSYANARLALGICLQLIDDIFHNKIENGFAIIRPPGHHASREEFNGYCYLNNAAITAHHALNNYGLKRLGCSSWSGDTTSFL